MRAIIILLLVLLISPARAEETNGTVVGPAASVADGYIVRFGATAKVGVRDVFRVVREGRPVGEAIVQSVAGAKATVVPLGAFEGRMARGDVLVFLRHSAISASAPPPSAAEAGGSAPPGAPGAGPDAPLVTVKASHVYNRLTGSDRQECHGSLSLSNSGSDLLGDVVVVMYVGQMEARRETVGALGPGKAHAFEWAFHARSPEPVFYVVTFARSGQAGKVQGESVLSTGAGPRTPGGTPPGY